MAMIRNLAISIHRLAGATNIAQGTRRADWDPPRYLDPAPHTLSTTTLQKGGTTFQVA